LIPHLSFTTSLTLTHLLPRCMPFCYSPSLLLTPRRQVKTNPFLVLIPAPPMASFSLSLRPAQVVDCCNLSIGNPQHFGLRATSDQGIFYLPQCAD
jgi:hypothetical protein